MRISFVYIIWFSLVFITHFCYFCTGYKIPVIENLGATLVSRNYFSLLINSLQDEN